MKHICTLIQTNSHPQKTSGLLTLVEKNEAYYRVGTQNLYTFSFASRFSAAETAELKFGLKLLLQAGYKAITEFWPQPRNGLCWRPFLAFFRMALKWSYLRSAWRFSSDFFGDDHPHMGRMNAHSTNLSIAETAEQLFQIHIFKPLLSRNCWGWKTTGWAKMLQHCMGLMYFGQ